MIKTAQPALDSARFPNGMMHRWSGLWRQMVR
jgi:hypothetical protein